MPARTWPAITTKGTDCLKCLAKGKGVFCHLHEDAYEEEAPKSNPSKQPTAAGGRTWPAITTKGTDCLKCLAKGKGAFCHIHEDMSEEEVHKPSKQATAAGGCAWPALTKKGEECLKCLAKGEGVFCHIHQDVDEEDADEEDAPNPKPRAVGGTGGAGRPATAGVRADGVRGLCLGASQNPDVYATMFAPIRNPDQGDAAEGPPHRGSPDALPDIERDVHVRKCVCVCVCVCVCLCPFPIPSGGGI